MSQSLSPASQILKDKNGPTLTQTMFCTKGNPNVEVVQTTDAGRAAVKMWFPHPITAFEWCLKNDASFVFTKG